MRTIITIILTFIISIGLYSQTDYSTADFTIKCEVKFDIKPDYRKSITTENASVIVFKISVTNNGDILIPDLGVTQRGTHLNLIINDSINNPVSMYNGVEIIGDHMLKKGQSDTYEWYIYTDNANETYGNEFTVEWEYLKTNSETIRVSVKTKEIKHIIKP